MKFITRTIWVLSLVSLFTDMASEMLYPVMPVYLKSIGFSVVLIGILEGFSEAIAGFSKGYFGELSDKTGRRVQFVRIGYGLSAISKPLMGFFVAPLWIFVSRSIDRMGKGVRTAARDALLSDESGRENKGKVFGFHRSMDTFGAVLGPLAALIYLQYYPEQYRTLFFIAFVPGVLAMLLSLVLKEKNRAPNHKAIHFFSFTSYFGRSSPEYRKLIPGLLAFTLFNSSDVFILLKMHDAGMSDAGVIGMYIFYNMMFTIFAYPIGVLADKTGLKKVFIGGLFVFALVYAGFSVAQTHWHLIVLYGAYGIYAAATEGISKAWISNTSETKDTATAIGTYMAFNSIATLVASSFAGLIWYSFGPAVMFLMSGIAAALVSVYLMMMKFNQREPT